MNGRMKILVLTNLFPSPWDPLRSSFNRQQFERLGQRHDVDVLTAVDFRERLGGVRGVVEIDALHLDYFTFVYMPGFGRSLHAFCWLVSLLLQRGWRLRAARYDCVLASWGYPDAVAAGWLARMLGIPYVVKVHGSDLNVQATHALRRVQIRGALRHAAAVVAVSAALADKAQQLGVPRSHVHVVYNGVDIDRFAPGSRLQAREHLGLAPDSRLLLYVGNLKAAKGCMDLLEAFPAVLAKQPQAQLFYVGAGAFAAELVARAAALHCADRVKMVGAVPHEQLANWFRAADLLCLPSHNEGVPNVILEAMACGTAAVASRVGGIPEVLPQYAGILVPPCDHASLSVALLDGLERDWDTARISEQAGKFRWGDNVDRLEHILQATTGRDSPHPL